MSEHALDALHHETRRFEPPAELAREANATAETYAAAAADRLAWWEEQARELTWTKPWDQVLEWKLPFSKWFIGGQLNACVNAVDRHVDAGAGEKVAFHWIGDGERDRRDVTYADLKREVSKAANGLTSLGVKAGDRVTIYMPMIPETVVTMLACARLGAPHNVVFCGFSSDSLRGRILDSDSHFVVTTDGQYRRGAPTLVKPAVDEALEGCPDVRNVLVVRRTGDDVAWQDGRDVWWHDVVEPASEEHEAESFDAEHPLFMMYTSGTTAKPKGILHTTGGYLTHVSTTHRMVFDLKPDRDIYWCAADIGWITGHSYIVYGPLINQATSVMYEGTPHPADKARWWKLIQDHKVSILYTAPTTIRTLMKWGAEELEPYDLTSLRLLGSVGEPINPEAWIWYRENVGGGRTPVVDTWWQTETGGIMITPLPGVTATKPGAAMTPFPGIAAEVVDNNGKPVGDGGGGFLVITEPWPGMLRGIWGDDERYKETYWSRFDGFYFAGDGAKKDEDGDLWLLGRVDDVMNVSGHRISTTEVEHALVSHPSVAEAAVVGAADATTGQAIVAFVTPRGSVAEDESSGDAFVQSLREHVAKQIGPIAKPRQVLVTPELPKTRSGKIMRRLLRDIAENRELGDVTTLLDPTVTDAIRQHMGDSVGKRGIGVDLPTAGGVIDTAALGRTLIHEHVFVMTTEVQANFKTDWDEEKNVADAIAKLTALKAAGIDSIADPTVIGLGRYIPRIARIAKQVDINIVVATGVYTYDELPRYFRMRGPFLPGMESRHDPMVDMFVTDITEGIADTGIRAAFLKCAIDEEGMKPGVERVLRAVAKAHVQTGAPVMVHTHPGTQRGLEVHRVLQEEGVDPRSVCLAHSGDSGDVDHLSALAEHGYLLGMDRFGVDFYRPFEERVAMVAELIRRGYGDRMALAHDASCYFDWVEPQMLEAAPSWNFLHISKDVLPALQELGISDTQIETLLVSNPRRWFETATNPR